jgi:hypothetical protein
MAGQSGLRRQFLHHGKGRLLKALGWRKLGGNSKQLERQGVFGRHGIARDITPLLQHAEHPKDLTDGTADPLRDLLLAEAAGLRCERFDQIEPLVESRRAGTHNRLLAFIPNAYPF